MFYGKLDEPIYLLVWRDSDAKVYVIEETPPFDGDGEAKDAFVARWQDAVDEAIAEKHPNVSDSVVIPHHFCIVKWTFNVFSGLPSQEPPERVVERREKKQRKDKETPRNQRKSLCTKRPLLLHFFVVTQNQLFPYVFRDISVTRVVENFSFYLLFNPNNQRIPSQT